MILNELTPTATTPELGGDFGDLRLKLRHISGSDIREKHFQGKAYNSIGLVDVNTSGLIRVDMILDAVQDWENMLDPDGKPVVFEKEKHREILKSFLLGKTGIPVPMKPGEKERKVEKYYNLEDYIENFTMDRENFLKNCAGTAISGCAGGDIGNPGKKKNF